MAEQQEVSSYVVIIDDEPCLREVAQCCLGACFPEACVRTAGTVAEGKEIILSLQSQIGKVPIVLVLDQQILSETGTEVAEWWEAFDPEKTRSLVLRWTGNQDCFDSLEAGSEGRADASFLKPARMAEMESLVIAFLERFRRES